MSLLVVCRQLLHYLHDLPRIITSDNFYCCKAIIISHALLPECFMGLPLSALLPLHSILNTVYRCDTIGHLFTNLSPGCWAIWTFLHLFNLIPLPPLLRLREHSNTSQAHITCAPARDLCCYCSFLEFSSAKYLLDFLLTFFRSRMECHLLSDINIFRS